jgi:putative phosphoribosyl transferase
MRFADRRDGGHALASRLMAYAERPDVVVLALPRGGVPVGFVVARALHAPLDVFLVRKLGVPGQEELAMGAIASGGIRVLNRDVVEGLRIPSAVIDRVAALERSELDRRDHEYRDGRPPPDARDKIVILVDDGLATGATMRAALVALRAQRPQKLIAAVPVAPASTCRELRAFADEVICVETPEPFYGVGMWYDTFMPTSDDEVRDLLRLAAQRTGADEAHAPSQPPHPPYPPPYPHQQPDSQAYEESHD